MYRDRERALDEGVFLPDLPDSVDFFSIMN